MFRHLPILLVILASTSAYAEQGFFEQLLELVEEQGRDDDERTGRLSPPTSIASEPLALQPTTTRRHNQKRSRASRRHSVPAPLRQPEARTGSPTASSKNMGRSSAAEPPVPPELINDSKPVESVCQRKIRAMFCHRRLFGQTPCRRRSQLGLTKVPALRARKATRHARCKPKPSPRRKTMHGRVRQKWHSRPSRSLSSTCNASSWQVFPRPGLDWGSGCLSFAASWPKPSTPDLGSGPMPKCGATRHALLRSFSGMRRVTAPRLRTAEAPNVEPLRPGESTRQCR